MHWLQVFGALWSFAAVGAALSDAIGEIWFAERQYRAYRKAMREAWR